MQLLLELQILLTKRRAIRHGHCIEKYSVTVTKNINKFDLGYRQVMNEPEGNIVETVVYSTKKTHKILI